MTRHRSLRTMIAISALFSAGTALAAPANAEDVIRGAARELGISRVDALSPSEDVKGFYEVRVGSQLLYISNDGQHLIEGNVIDIKAKRNLTQARVNAALAIDFDKLPLADALVTHKVGTGKRRIAVFADPSCGYCRRFEPTLAAMKDVTIYTFIIPVLGPRSEDIAKRIICSPSAAAAWRDWMLHGAEPPVAPSCSSDQLATLTRNKTFAAAQHITSTPTTFFEPRLRVPGAMTNEQILAALGDAPAAPGPASKERQATVASAERR